MYRRILLAVADDEALAAAERVAATWAREWGAAVRVLHVLPVDLGLVPEPSGRLVEEVVGRLKAQGVAADGEVRVPTPRKEVAEAVVNAASEFDADLVAIGSHGRSDLGAAILGSVSQAVAAELDVPVLVVTPFAESAARPRRVAVAVDGSDSSRQAAAEAGQIAAGFGAGVMVVHVKECVAPQGMVHVETDEEAAAVVESAVSELLSAGVEAAGVSSVNHGVGDAIVSTALRAGADLVVLGSRRPSAAGGLLLGSVAHEVIHRLPRPVLLARRVGVPVQGDRGRCCEFVDSPVG